jgi:hypothetical protein
VTAFEALRLTTAFAAVGAASTSLEGLWLAHEGAFGARGVWPWSIVKITSSFAGWWPEPVVERGVVVLLCARLIAAAWVMAALFLGGDAIAPLSVLAIAHVLLRWRTQWGGEGSDQMMLIVFVVGLIAALFSHSPIIVNACAFFIAGQITLSYIASGTAKLFGPSWRSGEALSRIMNHYNYGSEPIAQLLAGQRWLGAVVCYGVIAFQLTFPLYFVLPAPFSYVYLGSGVLFHVSIAYAMRLNLFIPVFLGTYPCLIFAHQSLHSA